METISTIASVIAAITGIITIILTVSNSKWNIRKRIERKKYKIRQIDTQFRRTYGLNANIGMHHPTSSKIQRLENSISKLEQRL